jgi:hypothetical protein
MSELPAPNSIEADEYEVPAEVLAEATHHLGEEATEMIVEVDENEASNDSEGKTASETVQLIDDYKAERGSVRGLSMKELVEQGFDPDMVLMKLGNERLEETLDIVNVRYRAERGTEQWEQMEQKEARDIPVTDDEVDALLDAGADPQKIVDALQRTKPVDDVDNGKSVRIVSRIDKLVDAGLPPAIIALRLTPGWREAVKDKLDDADIKWREANRLKAVA